MPSGFSGQRTYNIIGFVTGIFQDRDMVCADNIFYDGNRKPDSLRRLFPLRFVMLINFVAEGRSGRIKGDADMRGVFFFQNILQCIHESQDSRCVETFRGDPGIFNECIVRPVYQSVGIQKEKFVIFSHIYAVF